MPYTSWRDQCQIDAANEWGKASDSDRLTMLGGIREREFATGLLDWLNRTGLEDPEILKASYAKEMIHKFLLTHEDWWIGERTEFLERTREGDYDD